MSHIGHQLWVESLAEKLEAEFNAKVINIDVYTGIATLRGHDKEGKETELKIDVSDQIKDY